MALGLAAASALPAQVLTTLYSFCAGGGQTCPDGENISAGLVQGSDGSLYGTTRQGGTHAGGTVFRISTSGTLTTLYDFCAVAGCADGKYPYAGLALASSGTLYGTTQAGGTKGYGTVFSIKPAGALTTLYNFCSENGCADGGYPYAALFPSTSGVFYGTTYIGGNSQSQGTVFQITSSGALTTLYQFCSGFECPDGLAAMSGAIQANDGNLYGTAYSGAGAGWSQGLGNGGTIFKLTPGGTETRLYGFCLAVENCPDGYGPRAGLVQGSDGNLYGTTYLSGAYGDYGTIYKITLAGKLTTLYSFCAARGCPDGSNPAARLIQATDGNFYGTTQYGGAYNGGTVFRITPGGTLTTLYSFCAQPGCADGQAPYAGLFEGTDGNLYGTTFQGGAGGRGTVFKLSTGLGSFVEMLPASAPAGKVVQILGTNLTRAAKVSFNGTAAVFTVVSASQITATVPPGATNGAVQITTPSGKLSSNVAFQVLPGIR
ncbi:MAG TPA: choice-of-anchor tandem repeat GloVer-containing protein [Bryobacteraceae bacterium]|nr:choice-of-anchor tandem repeat GloVer-containing protein [Bryobacteraceae bacterium]